MSPPRHGRLLTPGRWPLANQLALSMLCVAAVAITGLFFLLNRANRAEVEQLQTTALVNSAQDLARRLDALVQNELSRVANLALSRSAQEFVAVRPGQRAALFTPTLADFSNFIASNPFYRAVLLLDRNGEVLISTDGSTVGRSFGSYSFFHTALRGTATMSDPGISPLDRLPVIWLAAPVGSQGRAADAPAGVVLVALSPEELWQAVGQVTIGQQGYAMLVDRYGIRLAHGRDQRYVFRSLAPLPPDTWLALQREGRFGGLPRIADTGSSELLGFIRSASRAPILIAAPAADVSRVYYSAARLSERDWTVVAMLAESEVLAPAANATLRGLLATVLVVVLLGLLVSWMAQRLVRPVPRLAQAAARIAAGDLSVPIVVRGSSELTELAGTFESMRQRLARARDELAQWAQTLERRVALRTRELAALSEVVALASREQSRSMLIQTAIERALPVMGAEIGGIWLAGANNQLQLAAHAGFDHELASELGSFAPGEGLLGQVQQHGEPLALADIGQAPRLARAIVRAEGLHAFAALPLRVSGRTLGVLGVFSHSQQGFSAETISLATSIAQQIALTLDNITLLDKLQEQARNVAALHERERIAGEIHDGIAQNLSYLYLQLDQLAGEVGSRPAEYICARLGRLQDVLETTTADVRQFIARLQASAPPAIRLGEQLRIAIAQLADELALPVLVQIGPPADVLVTADVSAELSRIVGEALRNAQRHGRATQARVEILRHGRHGIVSVRDDGAGFDPHAPRENGRGHYGLAVMQARAARIGGALTIESRPGTGTCIEVTWPVGEDLPVER